MILSDISIRKALAEGRIVIDPLDGRRACSRRRSTCASIATSACSGTTRRRSSTRSSRRRISPSSSRSADEGSFILHPGEFVLGSTLERVALPDDLVARLEGKVELGPARVAHPFDGRASSTPGWDGHLTLELSNVANLPIAIYPGMKIGQISFLQMTTPAEHPYGSGEAGSKYQGQRGPTPSRYYLNFRDR